MKVEIHSHTDLYSPCSRIPPRELIAMADASGYDALFLTEHQRVWPARELAGLRELSEHVRVFPGIEISFPDRVDLLVLGAQDALYETLRTPSEVLAQATLDGFLTVIAHPFRYLRELPRYCALADAMETCTCNHSEPDHLEAARRCSAEHALSEVYSSDAHGLNFMNKFWLETHASFTTPQEFRNLIVAGHYDNRTREFDMPLPPPYKAVTMDELTEEDTMALTIQPTS
ncbi:MAG: hypothetical protein HZB26_05975 [Candidatus Hydrogenedentes bacterium]|nr:hypothetical protein [Candidatus Hydrogenedentota bacterium]